MWVTINVIGNKRKIEYDDEWIHTYGRYYYSAAKRELKNMIEE